MSVTSWRGRLARGLLTPTSWFPSDFQRPPRMKPPHLKNVAVLGIAFVLASLGIYNIVLKATWTLMDDGVFWKEEAHGVVAGRVAAGGPGDRAGVKVGDVLLAVDGEEVLTSDHVQARLATRKPGGAISYSLLRADERRSLLVDVQPLPKGNTSLFYLL